MIPESVRKQAEEADKALEDMNAAQEAAAPVEEHSSDEPAAAERAENMEQLSGQPGEGLEASPEIQALQRELDLERQRTASLKGRVESQLTQANSENKELKSQVTTMQKQLDEMAKASAVPGPRRHISEEEASDLGEEVLGVQERIIKGTLEEELESGQIKDFVKDLVEQSMAAQTQQAAPAAPVNEELFWAAVDRYYPGAKSVNDSDSDWHAFLDLHDAKSGLKNRDIGVQAINAGDVALLVDLLTSYKPAEGHVGGERQTPIKPERTGSAPITEAPAKPTWKESEVRAFYEDVQRNRFKGTREEALAMENDIMEAAQEGRIID